MTTSATVSVEDYLNSPEYKHCEYLDGVINDKDPFVGRVPSVSNVHGIVGGLRFAVPGAAIYLDLALFFRPVRRGEPSTW